jgi:predicted GNAT superfamily acetyltransferase
MHRLAGVSDAVEIRELVGRTDMEALLTCFDQVWHLAPHARPMSTDVLLALVHAGNPVLGAFHGHDMVGASVAMAGVRPDGSTVLHSHMTGVLPTAQHTRVGRRLKLAQRDWARARRVRFIEWTFDPLVRRNGWFNLTVLGAIAPEYLIDFYGPLADGINAGDETDRLVAVWDVDAPTVPYAAETGDVLVPTPHDIVAVRRSDPAEARRWRLDMRRDMVSRLAQGWVVMAMTPAGDYVLRRQR